jgi:hypothetical protein
VWDDFIVFYAEKDLFLFKAPPSSSVPQLEQGLDFQNFQEGTEILYAGSTLLNNSAFFAEGNLITTSMSINSLHLITYSSSVEQVGFYSYQLTAGSMNLDCSQATTNYLLSNNFTMEVYYQLEYELEVKTVYNIQFVKKYHPMIGLTLIIVLSICFVCFVILLSIIIVKFK